MSIFSALHEISRTFELLTHKKFNLEHLPLGWSGQLFEVIRTYNTGNNIKYVDVDADNEYVAAAPYSAYDDDADMLVMLLLMLVIMLPQLQLLLLVVMTTMMIK